MKSLNTESLKDVANGLLAAAIDDALAKVHQDLDDRPGVDKDRTITIKLKMRPSIGDRNEDNGQSVDRSSNLEAARIEFQVNHTLPPQAFSRKMLNVRGKRAFGFETDTNSIRYSPNQMTFPDVLSDQDDAS